MKRPDDPISIIALAGSLRAASSNRLLLEAAQALAPEGTGISCCEAIGTLPHFNPDDCDDDRLPTTVTRWRAIVDHADGVLISCPEYAGGVPGAFKNALDWLVGGPEFHNKPVAILNASSRSSAAQSALRLILKTMSARVVEESSATFPLLGSSISLDDLIADQVSRTALCHSLSVFTRSIRQWRKDDLHTL